MLKRYYIILFLLSLLLSPSVCYGNYTITEEEMAQLDSNLIQLAMLTDKSEQELHQLNNQLIQSSTELTALKSELSELKTINELQEQSLKSANLSLKQYEKEVKRKQRILRWQRNSAWGVVIVAIVFAVKK